MDVITACAMQSRHRDGYRLGASTARDSALAGAGFVEAVLHDKVGIDNGRLRMLDQTPTGEGLVDEAVAQLGRQAGRPAVEVLGALARTFPRTVDRILKETGVVTSSWGRFLLVLPYRATRATDPAVWERQHDELVRVLRGDLEASERDVAVLHLLTLAGVSPRTFSTPLGGSMAVQAATGTILQHASTQWPRLCAALDVADAGSRRLRSSADAAAAAS